jgi:YD repeat-containing protein
MSSGTKTLDFGYDAVGNRVRKESTASGVTTKQWYVRDAQGNIMSTYKQVGTGTLKQEYVYLYGSILTLRSAHGPCGRVPAE